MNTSCKISSPPGSQLTQATKHDTLNMKGMPGETGGVPASTAGNRQGLAALGSEIQSFNA